MRLPIRACKFNVMSFVLEKICAAAMVEDLPSFPLMELSSNRLEVKFKEAASLRWLHFTL
jgi:hypothetical protein